MNPSCLHHEIVGQTHLSKSQLAYLQTFPLNDNWQGYVTIFLTLLHAQGSFICYITSSIDTAAYCGH